MISDLIFRANLINECYVVEEADEYFLPLPKKINGIDVICVHPSITTINNEIFEFDDETKGWYLINKLKSNVDTSLFPKYKYCYPINLTVKNSTDDNNTNVNNCDNDIIKSNELSSVLKYFNGQDNMYENLINIHKKDEQ